MEPLRQAGHTRQNILAFHKVILRILLAIAVSGGFLFGNSAPAASATQTDIIGPVGSGYFGTSVTVLANGNIVVTDPSYSGGGKYNLGAVFLYNGATAELISVVTGATSYDNVGSAGVIALSNGNFLFGSPKWDNGAMVDAGSITWGSGVSGISGVVSAANSLVGSIPGGMLGSGGVTTLSSGNYLVSIPNWDNGAILDVGAVTWGNGSSGVTGEISAANSLVGSKAGDLVGNAGITLLPNGNYLVSSTNWDNATVLDAGAVTFGSGASGVTGPITAANSLVGGTQGEQIGNGGCFALNNGNYLVFSPYWDNGTVQDAGAVTWGNGLSGRTGAVTASNSIVGSTIGDQVGNAGVTPLALAGIDPGDAQQQPVDSNSTESTSEGAAAAAPAEAGAEKTDLPPLVAGPYLTDQVALKPVGSPGLVALSNGNYLVRSPYWDNGSLQDAGAVTWGNGATGAWGVVSPANSVVGGSSLDQVGNGGVFPLTNGNYVISSPNWDNGSVVDAGAATWGKGSGGTVGKVTTSNSLVGSIEDDNVSNGGVTALKNGNYVVSSPYWQPDEGTNAGAATWGNGTSGVTGVISAANSLVGTYWYDQISSGGIFPLSNGHYVISSPTWLNSDVWSAGAVTWGNGYVGSIGAVSATNSLVGSKQDDRVGSGGVKPLTNGNYVVSSPGWDNGAAEGAGAVTWRSGGQTAAAVVSSANSLVGSRTDDSVGGYYYWDEESSVVALPNGNYLVSSPYWDNGAVQDAGAVTWGNGSSGLSGTISAANSLVGSSQNDAVGGRKIFLLNNGNYLVFTPYWDNGSLSDAGAVTWGSGTGGVTGPISVANSLVGSSASDQIGYSWRTEMLNPALPNGNFVIFSPEWDNGALYDAGAVTWVNGSSGILGVVNSSNSVIGKQNYSGDGMVYQYDPVNNQLVIGRPYEDIVTLFQFGAVMPLYLPMITK